mmetsp:Transcript_35392/g.78562  ORF Transcript_35392/g.78562 Transcript_35392/m.78562 type:complete len:410 (+) Transcript_35392:28-1257(+)
MVSTRRSARSTDSEAATVSGSVTQVQLHEPSSQQEPSSSGRRSGGSNIATRTATAKRTTASSKATSKQKPVQVEPIPEAAEEEEQVQQDEGADQVLNIASQQDENPQVNQAAAEPSQHGKDEEQADNDGENSSEDDEEQPGALDSDDDDDDDDGQGFMGGGTLSNLAASIRAALQSRGGNTSKSKPMQEEGEATSSGDEGDSSDEDEGDGAARRGKAAAATGAGADAAMRWRPQVELPAMKEPTRLVHQTRVVAEKEKGLAKQLLAPPRDPTLASKAARKAAPSTAGKDWYHLPATRIDDDMKQQLRLLRLRGAYDPKRFYKSFDVNKFPTHFQLGTVVDNPLDFYGGRLSQSQRKANITEQLLADNDITQSRKKRYAKLQESATQFQHVKRRKTELPRNTKVVKHKSR